LRRWRTCCGESHSSVRPVWRVGNFSSNFYILFYGFCLCFTHG
jgi:hypothetical protein